MIKYNTISKGAAEGLLYPIKSAEGLGTKSGFRFEGLSKDFKTEAAAERYAIEELGFESLHQAYIEGAQYPMEWDSGIEDLIAEGVAYNSIGDEYKWNEEKNAFILISN